MKLKHKARIMMLPASINTGMQFYSSGVYWDGKKHTQHMTTSTWCREQHLYIVLPQEIEPIDKGDWCYNMRLEGRLYQYKGVEPDSHSMKIMGTTNGHIPGVPRLHPDFVRDFVKAKEIFYTVEVEYEQYMTDGWVPTYNDPDNIGCHPMAEMDYKLKSYWENDIEYLKLKL